MSRILLDYKKELTGLLPTYLLEQHSLVLWRITEGRRRILLTLRVFRDSPSHRFPNTVTRVRSPDSLWEFVLGNLSVKDGSRISYLRRKKNSGPKPWVPKWSVEWPSTPYVLTTNPYIGQRTVCRCKTVLSCVSCLWSDTFICVPFFLPSVPGKIPIVSSYSPLFFCLF